AVAVTSTSKVDPAQPFTIALAIPISTELHLAESIENLVVIFKTKSAENSQLKIGVMPRADFQVEDGKIKVEAKFFGVYQAAYSSKPIEAAKVVETKIPFVTKSSAESLTPLAWTATDPEVKGRKARFRA